jgi:hypothetical protein
MIEGIYKGRDFPQLVGKKAITRPHGQDKEWVQAQFDEHITIYVRAPDGSWYMHDAGHGWYLFPAADFEEVKDGEDQADSS